MKRGPITLIVTAFLLGSVYTLVHHGYIQVQTQPAAVTTSGTLDDAPSIKSNVIDPAEAKSLQSNVTP